MTYRPNQKTFNHIDDHMSWLAMNEYNISYPLINQCNNVMDKEMAMLGWPWRRSLLNCVKLPYVIELQIMENIEGCKA